MELHHLPTGSVLSYEHSEQSLARQLRRAESIAAECAEADERFRADPRAAEEVFAPRPGIGCGWCDFRARCPEGMAAAPQRRPWDGLTDLADKDQGPVAAMRG